MESQNSDPSKQGTRFAVSDTTSDRLNGSRDEQEMLRLGKKQVLKRNFNFLSLFGLSCTALITWESVLVTYMQSFVSGGFASVVFGFIVVWFGTMSISAVFSELASMMPVSGGQYHWVFLLAPRSCSKILSYLIGWMTFVGWEACTASSGYLVGTLIQALIILTHPTYVPTAWQGMLLYWAAIWFAVLVNTVAGRALARFEGAVLVLHIFGFLAVLIPLVYLGPHGDMPVLTEFWNGGQWPSQGLSFLVGLSGSIFTLLGADSVIHLSEEVNNASIVIPRAIMTGIFVNGLLGFGMILAFLTCIGDVDAMLAAGETLIYPFLEVFVQATGSISGTAVMASIVVTMGICCNVGCVASSSRLQWSFARDHGFPFSGLLSKLDPRTSIPVYSVCCTMLISMLLSLVTLGSAVAFEILVSLAVSGLYSSYLICCVLLLWRRCRGDIRTDDNSTERLTPESLAWGRWRIPGLFGIANNVLACVYLLITWFFSFWPSATPIDSARDMNFSAVLFFGVLFFSLVWYLVSARKIYKGPVIEIIAPPKLRE